MVDAHTARMLFRNALAVVAGWLLGSALNIGLIQLNTHVLFPFPAGMDNHEAAQFNAYIATLPISAFVVILVAHLGQSFVGGWVAARLSVSHPMVLAMSVGGLSLVGGIVAMQLIEGPGWLAIELPLYLVVAWLAGLIETRRRAELPQES